MAGVPCPPTTNRAFGSAPNGTMLVPELCANGSQVACPKPALWICEGCLLVKYCSKECQKNDWAMHKRDCRKACIIAEKDCPYFESPDYGKKPVLVSVFRENARGQIYEDKPTEAEIAEYGTAKGQEILKLVPDGLENTKHLWGKTPAFDILKLSTNEGVDYDQDLKLYFGGADDLRHLMATILSVSETYKGQLSVIVNELDVDLQIRNLIIILLATLVPDGKATELITHLWYSASIPSEMYCLVTEYVLPRVKMVWEECKKAARERKEARSQAKEENKTEKKPAESSIRRMVVESGTTRLAIGLEPQHWLQLYIMLDRNNFQSIQLARQKRQNIIFSINPNHKKKRFEFFAALPPWQRVTEERYRQTGVLLPYGASAGHFDLPNPTFYHRSKGFLLDHLASPLDNQDLPRLHQTCHRLGIPPNDLHGALFFESKALVKSFCSHLKKINSNLVFSSEPGSVFSARFKALYASPKGQFDRIFLSDLVGDFNHLLSSALTALGPLLKTPDENPHAVLAALLTKATDNVVDDFPGKRYRDTLPKLMPYKWYRYSGLANVTALKNKMSFAEWRQDLLDHMEIQEEMYWDMYVHAYGLEAAAARAGLVMREEDEMKIAPAWPFRLTLAGLSFQMELQLLQRFTSSMKGSERFVEFRRN